MDMAYIYLVCTLVCTCTHVDVSVCHGTGLEVRGQLSGVASGLPLVEAGPLLLLMLDKSPG